MKKRIVLLCGLSAIAALVTQFPLVWAAKFLPDNVPSTIRYSGTLSQGSAVEPSLFGRAIFKTNFLSRSANFIYSDGVYSGEGQLTLGGIKALRSRGYVEGLSRIDRRAANLKGGYDLSVESLEFGKGGAACAQASGEFSTDVLGANYAYWQWRGPTLNGPITCENGDVVARLSGDSQSDGILVNVQGDVRISGDMTYRVDITVVTPDPRAGAILPLYGFDDAGGGRYNLVETGRLQR